MQEEKYHHINLEKPKQYNFVRGSSIEETTAFLTSSKLSMGLPPYSELNTLYFCAHHNFPKTFPFSKGFAANKEENIIEVIKDFAKMHAFQDYLAKSFHFIAQQGVNFDDFSAQELFKKYKKIFNAKNISEDSVHANYFEAFKRNGVAIYFNNDLLAHTIEPDPEFDYYTENNAIKITSKTPITIDTVIAIEPLGKQEKILLEEWL
ncbi:hypothetical protein K9M74_01800 [Candidatus Woesearchaeota archaeon]|nr:hypothetical protein [Candidatus Woesearchaeota archaeon]